MADLLRFTVPGKPEYVGVVRLAVSSAANTAGFDVEDIEDIKIAVSEVCTNVFCCCESTATYQIVCELGDDGIIISIADGDIYGKNIDHLRPCNEFPPNHTPENDVFDSSTVLLMLRALMDEVDIFSASQEDNTLIRMSKHFSTT